MKEYRRENPLFSLCGLNCGLCPRYHTEGDSKCPGCGGEDFHLKHPACAVITCNRKHDQVQYCFQCTSFPCEKYNAPSKEDSFITYRNVLADFEKARKEGLEQYAAELREKMEILSFLLREYNDGRRKNFYCAAINLFKLQDLNDMMVEIREKISKQDNTKEDKIRQVILLFQAKANRENIELL
jgi:hypothetical protein